MIFKKLVILLLVCSLMLTQYDCVRGAVPVVAFSTVLHVGRMYISHVWHNTTFRYFLASALAHVGAGVALWLAYDRGSGVPSGERYVTVQLSDASSELSKIANQLPRAGLPHDPALVPMINVDPDLLRDYHIGVDYSIPFPEFYRVWNPELLGKINNDFRARTIVNNADISRSISDAIIRDMARGGSFVSAPPSGSHVFPVDGVSVVERTDPDQPPPVGDQPPPVGDQPPPVGDQPPPVGDQPPPVGDQPPPVGDLRGDLFGDPVFPDIPGFDPTVDRVEEKDYRGILYSFFENHPFKRILDNFSFKASGDCEVSTNLFGHTVSISFCSVQPFLAMFGAVFLVVCTVRSFFIAMGVE
ncbi:MAG: hypothetical protein DDT23_00911 [candidate division WS2 bacterium]|nr:hypothetical protein [Candidatus Lithacetigena glycinireducens]